MIVTLQDIGRRYNREWIFRHLSYTFSAGKKYAILGPNGSGKSTLIKVISGSLSPSEGAISYEDTGHHVRGVEEVYRSLSMAAPYMELIEEFTLGEQIDFHFKHKSYREGFSKNRILELAYLESSRDKEIKHFSSGMKQRLKLALACCSATNLLLLDEPTSNLDARGEAWYLDLVAQTMDEHRIVIIGSNQPREYGICDEQLDVQDFKHFK